jgi:hypothetical protein
VGHVGLLGQEAFVERVESRARERSVLIEIPWPRVRELLTGDAPLSRRFAAALWTDVVRALQHGERPLARTRSTSPSRQATAGLLGEQALEGQRWSDTQTNEAPHSRRFRPADARVADRTTEQR